MKSSPLPANSVARQPSSTVTVVEIDDPTAVPLPFRRLPTPHFPNTFRLPAVPLVVLPRRKPSAAPLPQTASPPQPPPAGEGDKEGDGSDMRGSEGNQPPEGNGLTPQQCGPLTARRHGRLQARSDDGLPTCRRPKAAFFLSSSERFVTSTSVGIVTRPGRPLPGQDSHLLEQRTFHGARGPVPLRKLY